MFCPDFREEEFKVTYVFIDVWLLFLFLFVTRIPSGVKGLMLASLGLSDPEVESHSWKLSLDAAEGKDALLTLSSSNNSLDLRPNILGAVLGELMEQAEFGDPRPSNSLIALMVCEGGDKGEWADPCL